MFAFRVSDTWIAHKEVWIVHVLPVLWQVVQWCGGHGVRCGGWGWCGGLEWCGGCSSGYIGGVGSLTVGRECSWGGGRNDRSTWRWIHCRATHSGTLKRQP